MKRTVLLSLLCLIMVIFNLYLWRINHTLAATLETRVAQLNWFDKAVAEDSGSPTLPPDTPARGALALMKQLELEAKRADLDTLLTRMEQQSDNAVRLIFDEVSFNRLASWLHQVYRTTDLQPKTVTVTRLSTAGSVSAQLDYR